MAAPTNQDRTDPNAAQYPGSYTSEILNLFVDPISRLKDGQVLDVGPVCEENIMYFASRLRRLFVCDMFLRLIREKSVPRHSRNVWRHLDYPERFFDGIHLWDLCDHLDDKKVHQLVDLCHAMLQPGGGVNADSLRKSTNTCPDKLIYYSTGQPHELSFPTPPES